MLYVCYVRNTNKIHRIIFENESWGAGVLGTRSKVAAANFSLAAHFAFGSALEPAMNGRAANFKNRGGHTAHAQAQKRHRDGFRTVSARWSKAQRQDVLGTAAQVESGRGDGSHDWQVSSWEFFKNVVASHGRCSPHVTPVSTHTAPTPVSAAPCPCSFSVHVWLAPLPVRLAGTWTQRARLIRQLTRLVAIFTTAWRMWSHLHLAPVSQPGP